MRTRLTLEQKQWISGVIERFNHYLRIKAQHFYRYDDFSVSVAKKVKILVIL